MTSRCYLLALVTMAISAPLLAEDAAKPAAAATGQKYDLRYKFTPGETIRTQVVHLATVETTINGTTQHTETVSKSVKAWKVTDVARDGQITFDHSVESIEMKTSLSGRSEVHYNSKTDAKPPAGYEDAAKSVGKTLATVTIDPHGKVLKRSQPAHATNAAGASTALVLPLPEAPVPVGHVWTVPHELDVNLDQGLTKKIKTRERYELESVKNGVATIDVETQILTPVDDPRIRVQLIQKTSRGKIRFDIDAGRLIGQQLDLDERVLAFSGADSSMHYLTRFTESPVAEDKTAARQQKSASVPTPPAVASRKNDAGQTPPKKATPAPAPETKTAAKSTTIK